MMLAIFVVVVSVMFFVRPKVWARMRENLTSGDSFQLRMKLAVTRFRVLLHHLEQRKLSFRLPTFEGRDNWSADPDHTHNSRAA